jgi:hypothetical protein
MAADGGEFAASVPGAIGATVVTDSTESGQSRGGIAAVGR